MKKLLLFSYILLFSLFLNGQNYDTTKIEYDKFFVSWENAAWTPKCVVNLNLYGNGYDTLSPLIKNMTNLQLLYLKKNKLLTLPNEIGYLHKLVRVNFSYNKLTALPASFYKLLNIEELDLSNNKFVSFPNDIGNLKKVKKLYLQNNRITQIPSAIGGLESLEMLNLSFNRLTDLPNEITSLTNLKVLIITGNQISRARIIFFMQSMKNTRIIY